MCHAHTCSRFESELDCLCHKRLVWRAQTLLFLVNKNWDCCYFLFLNFEKLYHAPNVSVGLDIDRLPRSTLGWEHDNFFLHWCFPLVDLDGTSAPSWRNSWSR